MQQHLSHRVNLTYETAINGENKSIELPLKILILSQLNHDQNTPLYQKKKKTQPQ